MAVVFALADTLIVQAAIAFALIRRSASTTTRSSETLRRYATAPRRGWNRLPLMRLMILHA